MKIRHVPISKILEVLKNEVLEIKGPKENVYIDNITDFKSANDKTLDWINPNKADKQILVENSKAKVVLVDNTIEYSEIICKIGKTLIYVKNPKKAIAIVGNEFFIDEVLPGIHHTAIVSSKAKIGKNVHIGAFCVIDGAVIGDNTVISSNVRIYDEVYIGNHCYIKDGSVIGGPGFGYEVDDDGNRFRFPQLGGVHIGNFVEIGSNTCVDRGSLSNTIIEDYTKIDNLCHIAHNVKINKNAMIIACSEISGSCCIGENAWIGPNSSIRDWKNVGDSSFIGIGSVVIKNVPSKEVWMGNPARYYKNIDKNEI